MEKALQHRQAAQFTGLSPTGAGKHRSVAAKADHALIIKLDHSMGAFQLLQDRLLAKRSLVSVATKECNRRKRTRLESLDGSDLPLIGF